MTRKRHQAKQEPTPTQNKQLPTSRSNVTKWKLSNFYDFRNLRDVTRYKMQLQDALRSTDSMRLPTVTVIRRKRFGPTN